MRRAATWVIALSLLATACSSDNGIEDSGDGRATTTRADAESDDLNAVSSALDLPDAWRTLQLPVPELDGLGSVSAQLGLDGLTDGSFMLTGRVQRSPGSVPQAFAARLPTGLLSATGYIQGDVGYIQREFDVVELPSDGEPSAAVAAAQLNGRTIVVGTSGLDLEPVIWLLGEDLEVIEGPTKLALPADKPVQGLRAVAGEGFVLVSGLLADPYGRTTALWRYDGASWSSLDAQAAPSSWEEGFVPERLVAGAGSVLAIDDFVMSTRDGLEWEQIELPIEASIVDALRVGDEWVLLAGGELAQPPALLVSGDLESWTVHPFIGWVPGVEAGRLTFLDSTGAPEDAAVVAVVRFIGGGVNIARVYEYRERNKLFLFDDRPATDEPIVAITDYDTGQYVDEPIRPGRTQPLVAVVQGEDEGTPALGLIAAGTSDEGFEVTGWWARSALNRPAEPFPSQRVVRATAKALVVDPENGIIIVGGREVDLDRGVTSQTLPTGALVWRSVDGTTVEAGEIVGPAPSTLVDVAVIDDGTLVAVGFDIDGREHDASVPVVLQSDDGATWRPVPIELTPSMIGFTPMAVAQWNERTVIAGHRYGETAIFSSSDLLRWVDDTPDEIEGAVMGLCADGSGLWAVGIGSSGGDDRGMLLRSGDGRQWKSTDITNAQGGSYFASSIATACAADTDTLSVVGTHISGSFYRQKGFFYAADLATLTSSRPSSSNGQDLPYFGFRFDAVALVDGVSLRLGREALYGSEWGVVAGLIGAPIDRWVTRDGATDAVDVDGHLVAVGTSVGAPTLWLSPKIKTLLEQREAEARAKEGSP